MKKFFAAVCCVLLVGGSVVAQEAVTPVAEAAAPVAATEVAAPIVQEAAPVIQEAAPVAGSIMEGTVVGQPVMVQSSGCCGGGVVAPYSAPVMTSVVGQPMAAPVATGCNTCGTTVAAPVATGCNTCGTSTVTRRYVVRSTVSGLRSRVGNIGSRRSSCCN